MLVVLQQNSAADLSMLVLESLEKAEVDVADELLGEDSTCMVYCAVACQHGLLELISSTVPSPPPVPLGGGQGWVSDSRTDFCHGMVTLAMPWAHTTDLLAATNPTEPACGC